MRNRMFPLVLLGALVSAGCAVVGYPAPVRGPVAIVLPPSPTPSGDVADAIVPARTLDASGDPVVLTGVRTYEVFGRAYTTLATSAGYLETGLASWYGDEFQGRPTASGERFDMYALTAAHRTLPLPTCVEVRRVDDDRRVTVRVNDRGPFDDDDHRIIDLSFAAGRALGLIGAGTTEVEVRAMEAGTAC